VKPTAISGGRLLVRLDPAVFGSGASVGLFGAHGDAQGRAAVTESGVDIQFSSPTAGIGQLPGLPVAVISVPVLASAAGRTVSVTATSPDSSLEVASGSVTVKGALSVAKIPAGMGVAPAGTIVPITGTGFTASTTVTIEGVAISSTRFVSPQEVNVTLGGAAELVGKLARVKDGEAEFEYFCFQPDGPVNFSTSGVGGRLENVQPLFPVLASMGFRASSASSFGGISLAIQNPNASTATVTDTALAVCCGPLQGSSSAFSIPAGGWIVSGIYRTSHSYTSDLPLRAVSIGACFDPQNIGCLSFPPRLDARGLTQPAPEAIPSAIALTWQRGSKPPPARTLWASSSDTTLTLSAATTSGGPWLSVSGPNPDRTYSVAVEPSQLGVGSYQGSILVRQSFGPSATVPVTLQVTEASVATISASPATLDFSAPAFDAAPLPRTVTLTSDFGAVPFTVTVPSGTWLKVSPASGTTPATLTVTWDPAVTSQIYYQQRSTPGSILVSGPGNAITIPATFSVTGIQTFQTYLGTSGIGANGLVFSAQAGSTPQTQTINVDPAGAITATVDQPWMTAAAPGAATVAVTANPAGLAPGVHRGTVTIAEPGIASIAVPVTLGVWSDAPRLTITRESFHFVQTLGEPAPPIQTAEVSSGGVPVPVSIAVGERWFAASPYYNRPTPAKIVVGLFDPPQTPGEYDGSFTVQSPGGSLYVPVKLLVEPGPVAPPVVSQVVNAASGLAGGVSPGEIVAVRGYGVGGAAAGALRIGEDGLLATQIHGLQVTFDGKPAPLIYTSPNQTNLIVPYEVAGRYSTVMQVSYVGASGTLQTSAWALPVASSSPGVFTVDATATGQAAVVNEDGTVNSATNPARRGSIVSIYATGEGQTSPEGVTGSVVQSGGAHPVQSVTVTIGGTDAAVQYAGAAPDQVAGLLQVNAVVPALMAPGTAVPLTVRIGGVPSQAGVSISVR
jgi:uncharacterized protein (TIGR03437 family)